MTCPGCCTCKEAQDGLARGGALHHVRFSRAEGSFGAADRERAALLAKRLGVTVELAG